MPAVTLSRLPTMDRSWFDTEDGIYPVPLTWFRTWDAMATNLPAAGANDDLGLVTGTLASTAPTLQSGDSKATTTTRYARFQIPLPQEYTAGGSVLIRIKCGMTTTVSDTTATVDVQAYRVVRDGTVGSDLCATAATTINSLTHADREFTITPTTLSPGELLDVRVAIAIVDGATATAVIGTIDAVELVCDVRG